MLLCMCAWQSNLELQNLGMLYHEPIREANGAHVVALVRALSPRDLRIPISIVSTLTWTPMDAFTSRIPQVPLRLDVRLWLA